VPRVKGYPIIRRSGQCSEEDRDASFTASQAFSLSSHVRRAERRAPAVYSARTQVAYLGSVDSQRPWQGIAELTRVERPCFDENW
jgi:hypothetical protein